MRFDFRWLVRSGNFKTLQIRYKIINERSEWENIREENYPDDNIKYCYVCNCKTLNDTSGCTECR